MGRQKLPDDQVSDSALRQRKYREDPANRLKGQIRSKVHAAIKGGRLKKMPCEVCGVERVEAHHYLGYAPEHILDIQWLCKTHHEIIHNYHRKGGRPRKDRLVEGRAA